MEGDNNTRLFHRVANGKRKKNVIKRLEVASREIIKDPDTISQELVNFFLSALHF